MGASFYVSRYVIKIFPVDGDSMYPTVLNGDKVVTVRTKNIKHGDIIVFDNAEIGKRLLKRVIGLEGDLIVIKEDEQGVYHVYRNGERLSEDYISMPMRYSEELTVRVTAGRIFFLGDNRNISLDSHTDGVLANIDDVLGKVYFRISDNSLKRVK